jgi:hypothetical protein
MDHYISMNAFEPLAWMGCALILIRIINTGNQKLWLWFGLIAGIALENKYGIVFFAAGVVAGLLLTQHRSMFLKPWIWLAYFGPAFGTRRSLVRSGFLILLTPTG